jgi:hypothetical protein
MHDIVGKQMVGNATGGMIGQQVDREIAALKSLDVMHATSSPVELLPRSPIISFMVERARVH